jgi:bifunctional non-homologous end joining protein LigD
MPPRGTPGGGSRPTPTGRRKTTIPVIEISRAATKAEALEGLERWKERHPEAARHLEPADILTDGMRRPAQEALDPDYDPWAGYEWPDRSGQLERAPRRSSRGPATEGGTT